MATKTAIRERHRAPTSRRVRAVASDPAHRNTSTEPLDPGRRERIGAFAVTARRRTPATGTRA